MFKKTFSLILAAILLQFNLTAFGAGIEDEAFQTLNSQNLTKPVINKEVIKDEVPASNLKSEQTLKPQMDTFKIDDNAVQDLKNQNLTKPVVNKQVIKEDIPLLKIKSEQAVKPAIESTVIEDKVIPQNLKAKTLRELNPKKPAFNYQSIDYDTNNISIPIASINFLTIKKTYLDEGQKVSFKVVEDVIKNGELFIKKETPVSGIIETITKSSRGGDPEELIIGRFETQDIYGNKISLAGEVQKKGANRALWIRPLVWVGCASFFGSPLVVLLLIKGGRVKILPTQTFKLDYYE